jgi:hypothetical protein
MYGLSYGEYLAVSSDAIALHAKHGDANPHTVQSVRAVIYKNVPIPVSKLSQKSKGDVTDSAAIDS